MFHGSQCGPLSPGSRLNADHPENGVLIPRRFTVGDGRRQREHDMEVRHRQQVGLARSQPVLCRGGLTLRAMAVAAAVVSDGRICDETHAFSCPRAELIDFTGSRPRVVREVTAKVEVLVHYRQAEFDRHWVVDGGQVQDFAKVFTSAPSVDSRLF
jgi:hypothetical protein